MGNYVACCWFSSCKLLDVNLPLPEGINGRNSMSEEEKKKNGRPKKKIDKELVEKLATIHCSVKEIADIIGCHPDTIRNRFSDIIARGKANGKMSLRRKQMEVALSGQPTMLIWLGKQWLGQSESPMDDETNKILPWTDDLDGT